MNLIIFPIENPHTLHKNEFCERLAVINKMLHSIHHDKTTNT